MRRAAGPLFRLKVSLEACGSIATCASSLLIWAPGYFYLSGKIFSGSINTGDSIKNVNNFDLNAVETRDTVRALVLALEACGLVVKIDQSLPNR